MQQDLLTYAHILQVFLQIQMYLLVVSVPVEEAERNDLAIDIDNVIGGHWEEKFSK